MIDDYINKSFRILHLTKQPQEMMDIYSEFMWNYHNKHRESFTLSGQIRLYNEQQALTFYRYVRLNYMPKEV